jgi:hypothetical protein
VRGESYGDPRSHPGQEGWVPVDWAKMERDDGDRVIELPHGTARQTIRPLRHHTGASNVNHVKVQGVLELQLL